MRYYKITIDKAVKTGSSLDTASTIYQGAKTFMSGPNNRTPLDIEFEVASFSGGMAALPGMLSIKNPTPDFFVEAQSYIGARLTLRAGFEDSMFAKKIGYTFVSEDLIFIGQIANVLGDFSTYEPTLYIFFSIDSEAQKRTLEAEKNPSKSSSLAKSSQLKELTLNIPKEAKIAPFLVKGIEHFTNWLVKPDTLLSQVTNPWTQAICLTAGTLETLLFLYKEYFGVEIAVNTQQQLITLYEQNGAQFVTNAVEIAADDFLQQPEILDLAGQISCMVRLRADIQIGTVVNIVGLAPSTAQLVAGVAGGFVPTSIAAANLFALGSYRVVQVTHKGSYSNAAVESWSTTFIASPITNGKSKFSR